MSDEKNTTYIHTYAYVKKKEERRSRGPNHIFYGSPLFENNRYWERFGDICKREVDSRSEKIRSWIMDYVRLHEEGNPQLSLERYTEPQGSLCECGKEPFYRVTMSPTGPILFLCQECFPEFRRTHSGFAFIELDKWKETKR